MGPALMIAGAAGVTVLGTIARGKTPSPRVFLGAAIAGGFVLAFAGNHPQVAQQFAGLVFATALLTSGYDVAQGVTSSLNGKKKP